MLSDAPTILARIEARLGFVPPFFEPAIEHPAVLENLWHQTESAYLDNGLPALFKEKLAALLGRYCEVPYCLLCHTCSLRPLGMSGGAIVDLLTQEHPTDERAAKVMARFAESGNVVDLAIVSPTVEADVFCLASLVYHAGPHSAEARAQLRARLTAADYRDLIVFTSYNRMCHDWMAAHPEVSYAVDARYVANYDPLVEETPAVATTLRGLHRDDEIEEDREQLAIAARSPSRRRARLERHSPPASRARQRAQPSDLPLI